MTSTVRTRRDAARLAALMGVVGSAVMVVVSALGVVAAPPSGAEPNDAGVASVIVPNDPPVADSGQTLDSGGSATPLSLKLPTSAACPEDSANGGFRLSSFMVPESVDVATLTFSTISGPTPNGTGATFRQPLFQGGSTVAGEAYTAGQTAAAAEAGGPGEIIDNPPFDLSIAGFTDADIPEGTYKIGIACYKGPEGADQLFDYWTALIDITHDDADTQGGFTWAVQEQTGTTTTTTTTGDTTTTTGDGTTTTTSAGGTTTTAAGGSTSSTVAGATSSTAGTGGPSTGGSLPKTGDSPVAMTFWAFVLLVFGRMAYVLSRPPKVRIG